MLLCSFTVLSLTDGKTPIQRDILDVKQLYFAETYSFCLSAEHSGTEPSIATNVSLKLILPCTQVSCSGSKQLSHLNYTFPHPMRVVLESRGCFGLVKYVSDFMLWFKIVSIQLV